MVLVLEGAIKQCCSTHAGIVGYRKFGEKIASIVWRAVVVWRIDLVVCLASVDDEVASRVVGRVAYVTASGSEIGACRKCTCADSSLPCPPEVNMFPSLFAASEIQ